MPIVHYRIAIPGSEEDLIVASSYGARASGTRDSRYRTVALLRIDRNAFACDAAPRMLSARAQGVKQVLTVCDGCYAHPAAHEESECAFVRAARELRDHSLEIASGLAQIHGKTLEISEDESKLHSLDCPRLGCCPMIVGKISAALITPPPGQSVGGEGPNPHYGGRVE